jgi:phosphoribosylglycinamide formyltransferase 1
MTAIKPRIGIIGSSGGSALIAADECLRAAGEFVDWVVVTDRECGLGQWAISQQHQVYRVIYSDAETFSRQAAQLFLDHGCCDVLLFYTRIVTSPLIERLRVWNIHPALLPAFPGLSAIHQAENAKVRIFGATLHRVNTNLDSGPIVAQIADIWPENTSLEKINHLSFQQKVWLTLIWFEHLSIQDSTIPLALTFSPLRTGLANPNLNNLRLAASYSEWLDHDEQFREKLQ